MALTVGTNSFVTNDEADAIIASRLQVGAWTDASEDTHERALEESFWYLNYLDWIGHKTDQDGVAAWPRQGVPDPDSDGWDGYNRFIDENTIPERVKRAQVEYAIGLLEVVAAGGESGSSEVISSLTGINKVRVGDIEVESGTGEFSVDRSTHRAASGQPLQEPRVRFLIEPFLRVGAGQFTLVP